MKLINMKIIFIGLLICLLFIGNQQANAQSGRKLAKEAKVSEPKPQTGEENGLILELTLIKPKTFKFKAVSELSEDKKSVLVILHLITDSKQNIFWTVYDEDMDGKPEMVAYLYEEANVGMVFFRGTTLQQIYERKIADKMGMIPPGIAKINILSEKVQSSDIGIVIFSGMTKTNADAEFAICNDCPIILGVMRIGEMLLQERDNFKDSALAEQMICNLRFK